MDSRFCEKALKEALSMYETPAVFNTDDQRYESFQAQALEA